MPVRSDCVQISWASLAAVCDVPKGAFLCVATRKSSVPAVEDISMLNVAGGVFLCCSNDVTLCPPLCCGCHSQRLAACTGGLTTLSRCGCCQWWCVALPEHRAYHRRAGLGQWLWPPAWFSMMRVQLYTPVHFNSCQACLLCTGASRSAI